jgi:hypothetical protein
MCRVLCLCAVIALSSTGCAAYIAGSGADLSRYTTRDQVRASFGEPIKSNTNDDEASEDFRCRVRLAENARAVMLMHSSLYSLGLADLVYVPVETGRVGWHALFGYDVHFQYDAAGKVKSYTIDGLPGMEWPLR